MALSKGGKVASIVALSSLKSLHPVKFTFESPKGSTSKKNEEDNPICPSCKKGLSNSILTFCKPLSSLSPSYLGSSYDRLGMKPCGHVTCKTCTDTLVKPAGQCVECDAKLTGGDVIGLKREGELS